jgi:hypothetical protein
MWLSVLSVKRLWCFKIFCLTPCKAQVVVVYDSATGEKNVIHEPSNSQSLEFETVEVISRDSISLSAYAKYEYLDFARRHDWKRNHKSVFRFH